MPRLKSDPRNHKYRELEILIGGAIKAERLFLTDICRILQVSEPTARKYLRNPETMSLESISKLGRSLHIPIDTLRELGIKY